MAQDMEVQFVVEIDTQLLLLRMVEAFLCRDAPHDMSPKDAIANFERESPILAEGLSRAAASACEYMTEQISAALKEAGCGQADVFRHASNTVN
jgi:hypothetical protein